ncbi:efflux RND transporter periplasmic adaptor subunit [Zavarzinia compransoris]|uniref:Efflux transporter periplasmic adaptor subunit n=1 Tax=Zavarzinia compransoris TaxID=1264899 RepID=A0A317E498_9PROT|nr:efflux RND transporter periplasmic adaptor subunit [Zavarzinia compransoris]PWR21867.1 efflux transporter periplasmic adaptor subunit [Zavarzinia compransoris]TDP45327.1 macrolide-specific efflux system membrane fusion protein [Zavarzinia compransoris]
MTDSRPSPRSRRAPRRRWGLALVVLLVLGGGGWWYFGNASKGAAVQYVTAAVGRGDIEDTVSALGNLQPRDYVDVGTQVSGQLKVIHAEVGDQVKQGDLLAEIDPTVYQSRVAADEAQLLALKAQLADREAQAVLAGQQLKRQRTLWAQRATTEEALQSAEAAAKSADAAIDQIKAQILQTESTLRGDQANLGYTKIYAPMTGTVTSLTARRGQTLNANQSAPIILQIADLSVMTVETQVSEADISRLKVGMEAYFTTLGGGTKRWTGKLKQILPTPEVVNNVVLYNALFDVDNADGMLMTQMSAQVFFVVASARDAITVPVAALKAPPRRPEGAQRPQGPEGAQRPQSPEGAQRPQGPEGAARPAGRPYLVQVMGADGQPAERRVRIGVANRVSAEVLDGLQPGDTVVVGQRGAGTAGARAPAGGQQRPGSLPGMGGFGPTPGR